MSSLAFERSRSVALSSVELSSGSPVAPAHVDMLRGQKSILRQQEALAALASGCGQPGAMDDLEYFLSRPQLRKKAPCLVTLSPSLPSEANASPGGAMEAAVLLYEHRMGGRSLHIFATDDTTGRRTLIAAPCARAQFALAACLRLLEERAQCILISFRHDGPGLDPALAKVLEQAGCAFRWASREREIAGYLRFEGTLDETMARMGARTRNHLRYYRKRAENQLGAVFEPEAKIAREDFLELNGISAYPAKEEIAAWRYDSLARLGEPLLYGMRDRDGRWLSLIGGRHSNGNMEMYWQMNRADMPSQSLSTAMRALLIEHEVARGTKRMYVEGGTTHSMSHAFVTEKVTDLIVMRRSAVARLIPALVKRFLPPENMLVKVLEDEGLKWTQS